MRDNIKRYRNNFLTNVVVQFDFLPVKRFIETVPNDIIEALKQDYSFHQGQIIADSRVNVITGASFQSIIPVWEFNSNDNAMIIQLSQSFLKFNCTKYENFENLKNIVNETIKLLENDVDVITRLGLRYINQIDLKEENPLDWDSYINNSLICTIDTWCGDIKNNISRAMSQIVITGDDYNLNFNYGIFNPIFPNKIIQKQFILDFDCYVQNISYKEIDSKLCYLNNIITDSFEKSIEDGLREKMEIINEQ